MSTRLGIEAGCESWPNTKAISCRKRAEGSEKPSANALTAGIAVGRSGGEERSRRANMALYRSKRGNRVFNNLSCSSGIESGRGDCVRGGAGSIDVKSLIREDQLPCVTILRRSIPIPY